MPELPEVETIRKSIESVLLNKKIVSVEIHDTRLRWPVIPADFPKYVETENKQTPFLVRSRNPRPKGVVMWTGYDGPVCAWPPSPLRKSPLVPL